MAVEDTENNDGQIYSRIIKQYSAREKNIAMASHRNTKLILSGAFALLLIVCCSVAVARVITNDEILFPSDNDGPITSARIVEELRNRMNDTKIVNVPIQAYLIPSVDAHQSEYIAESDRRMEYVTGFSGSYGTAVITENLAALWTDSRYFLQAEHQLDNQTWILMKLGQLDTPSIEEWLVKVLPPNSRIGIDPFLLQATEFKRLSDYLGTKGHKLEHISQNLVDLVWVNRPAMKTKPLEALERRFSGKRAGDKVADVREAMQKSGAECLIVTTLDDIAWLLNLRGTDIEANPVFFAYVILTMNELHLYILDRDRIHNNYIMQNHFYTEKIVVQDEEYNKTVSGISNVMRTTTGKVIVSKASQAIQSLVPADRILSVDNPIVLMKIIKNAVEAEGIRNAHYRDGVAMVRYLHWLECEIDAQVITEMSGADKLAKFRSKQENFKGLSFNSCSAVGAHAAIVHYTPTLETNKPITRNEIYLIDSGAQYSDGTTDVTRTIHLGEPTKKEIDAFTRVLKGFISLSTAIFPPKAPYSFFDAMARRALWDVGLDYGHGTGHGIGAYLNVHEYPPLISHQNSKPGMLENMFTSNEPGYYEADTFGVRIESIIQVKKAPDTENYFNGNGALKFADITMVPIQTKLIDVNLLTASEIEWLNKYHAKVRKHLTPLLSGADDANVVEWLNKQTEPIGPNSTEESHDNERAARFQTHEVNRSSSL